MSPGWVSFIIVAVSILVWAGGIGRLVRGRRLGHPGEQAMAQAASEEGGPRTAAARRAAPVQRLRERRARRAAAREARVAAQPQVTVERVPERSRKPLDPAAAAMSRRQFLNRAWGVSGLLALGVFGMGSLAFLWPRLTGGFGTKLTIGDYADLIKKIGPEGDYVPQFFPEGRFWLTYYDGTGDDPAYLAVNAKKYKMQALYRKCVHLGCSVPWCNKSYLYECPCHGSKYLLTGEYFAGPAPRGLDRFPIEVSGGKVHVDTSQVITGPPRGTVTWSKFAQPKGPFCVPT